VLVTVLLHSTSQRGIHSSSSSSLIKSVTINIKCHIDHPLLTLAILNAVRKRHSCAVILKSSMIL
jgi:hypothetical protein